MGSESKPIDDTGYLDAEDKEGGTRAVGRGRLEQTSNGVGAVGGIDMMGGVAIEEEGKKVGGRKWDRRCRRFELIVLGRLTPRKQD